MRPIGRIALAGYPSCVVPSMAGAIMNTFMAASNVRKSTATPLSTRPVQSCFAENELRAATR